MYIYIYMQYFGDHGSLLDETVCLFEKYYVSCYIYIYIYIYIHIYHIYR